MFCKSIAHAKRPGSARIAVPAAALLLLVACGQEGDKATEAQARPPATPSVTVAKVERKPITDAAEFVGRIEAIDEVAIRARVQGFLERRLFDEGDTVKTGKLLYIIERAPYQAQVQQREADVARAEANALNAAIQLERVQELAEQNAVSEAEVDERVAANGVAQAAVQQAEAALREARINLGYTEVEAPVDGRIGRTAYTIGNLVSPASGALTTLVSVDPMYVTFPVSQEEILQVQRQAARRGEDPGDVVVRLRFADGSEYPHTGHVDFLAPQVDPSTDTLTVRAVVPNPDGVLVDNQFADVRVEEKDPTRALVVPQVALQFDQTGTFVLVVNDKNKVQVRHITVGTNVEGEAVVEKGLEEGERVITQGIQAVQPGQTVKPTAAPPIPGP